MLTPFRKVHGAGNDFILITGPDPQPPAVRRDTAVKLCARRTGIGADGLVISTLISTDPAVLDVTCLNADGSTATMCGNALRCSAWCAARDYGFQSMTLVMAGVKHEAVVTETGAEVTADVGAVDLRILEAVWNGRPFWFDTAHTGTEHVVAVVIATHRGLVAQRPVTVHNRAGTPLTVRPHPDRPGRAFWVAGPVTQTYQGELV